MATDISHEKLLTMLSYDRDTGEFKWREEAPNYSRRKQVVGRVDANGRRYVNIDRKFYSTHRLAWFYVTKQWSRGAIVPKNGNYDDTRFDNLQELSHQALSARRSRRGNASSGATGVSWSNSKNQWVAYITINYKRKHIGYFKVKEDAIAAYAKAQESRDLGNAVPHEDLARYREAGRRTSRLLSLWRRVNRRYGQTAWPDQKAFNADIGLDLHDRQEIVPIDASRPIGPGNWQWQLSLYYRYDNTPEGRKEYDKARREHFPFRRRAHEFLKKFGLTLDEYFRMHDEQNGCCACCGKPEVTIRRGNRVWLAVDHCHSSGIVRGLLCNNCNQGLGLFKDDPVRLRKAADYLERHASKTNGAALDQPPIGVLTAP